jgi:16S rRNA (guanine966-N2)-methyltransferase
MRIIGGTSKGRKLAPVHGRGIRPTSDRVKESIFNILGGDIEDQIVLDLFAGTGNLGLEALSRGASRVLFVEKSRQALSLIQRNLSQCGMEDRAEILPTDALRAIGILNQRKEVFDLILMDPPYEKGLVQRMLTKIENMGICHADSILVIEHDRREALPSRTPGWALLRERKIGDTLISFLTPTTDPAQSTWREPFSNGSEPVKARG